MKLTDRELYLVKSINRLQRQKVWALAGLVIVLLVDWILRYSGVLRGSYVSFDSPLMFYLMFFIISAFSNMHNEARLVELLRRYVNEDSEALAELAERK